MEERPDDRLAEELQAIMDSFPFAAAASETGDEEATPEDGGEGEADEDVIRARLRQVRQDTAHIPVAEEKAPGLIGKIKGLLGR